MPEADENGLALAYRYLREADQLRANGETAAALECLQQAFELGEKRLPAFFYLERAELLAALGKWNEALDDYRQYRRRFSGRLLLGEALAHFNLWKQQRTPAEESKAQKGFQEALEWAEEHADPEMQMQSLTYLGILAAETAQNEADFKQAWEYYDKALKLPAVSGKVQAELYYNRATLLLRQGKKSPALSNLEYAAENDPQNVEVARLQGWIEFGQGKRAAAEKAWRRAVEIAPEVANLTNLGMVLMRQRKLEEARQIFEQALASAKEQQNDEEKGAIQNWLGVCELAEGDFKEAARLFEEVVEQDPQNGAAWGNLGATRFYLGRKAGAKKAFARANEAGQGGVVEQIWAAAFARLDGEPDLPGFEVETEMAQLNPDYEPAEYDAARWLARAFAGIEQAVEAYAQAQQNLTSTSHDKLSQFYWQNLANMLERLYTKEKLEPKAKPNPQSTSIFWGISSQTEERFLDAAISRQVIVGESTELLLLIRLFASEGLRKFLKKENYQEIKVRAEEIKSQNFNVEYVTHNNGNLEPIGLWVNIETTDFDMPVSQRKIKLQSAKDSELLIFLVTPKRSGKLKLIIHIALDEETLLTYPLRAKGVTNLEMSVRTLVSIPFNIFSSKKPKLKVFLAYANADLKTVSNLYERLKKDGFDPWMEDKDLLPGQDIKLEIARAVRNGDVVILCLSKAAISQPGPFNRQMNRALDVAEEMPEDKIFLIPLLLDDAVVPGRLEGKKPTPYQNGQNYPTLLRSLQASTPNNPQIAASVGTTVQANSSSNGTSSTGTGAGTSGSDSSSNLPSLSGDDRTTLIDMLRGIGSFRSDPATFLVMAGFPSAFADNLLLPPGNVMGNAQLVVARVENYRRLPKPPYTPGLMALIEQIMKQGISQDDREVLEEIIRKNQLVPMPKIDTSGGLESAEVLQAIHTIGEWFTNANYFVRGYKALQAVCRIEPPDLKLGTGFLVAPDLVLTNYHVVSGKETEVIPEAALYERATTLKFRFGYLVEGNSSNPGYAVMAKATATQPAVLAYSESGKLDFALLRLSEPVGTPDKFGILESDPREIAVPETSLILQHPGGREMEFHPGNIKRYVNDPQDEGKSRLHYSTNTQGGSSGSPVFDKHWQVIGLHHSGPPYPALDIPSVRDTNEGIPLIAIWPHIEKFVKS